VRWTLRTDTPLKVALAVATLAVFAVYSAGQPTGVNEAVEQPATLNVPVTTATPSLTTVAPTPPTSTTITTTTITTPTTTTTSAPPIPLPVIDTHLVSIETPPLSQIETVICNPKWDWDCEEALRVAWCESWHRPRSVSSPNRDGTIDRGIFQVNDVWREAFGEYLWGHILDLETNVAMAHHIWKTGNDSWLYWTCQP